MRTQKNDELTRPATVPAMPRVRPTHHAIVRTNTPHFLRRTTLLHELLGLHRTMESHATPQVVARKRKQRRGHGRATMTRKVENGMVIGCFCCKKKLNKRYGDLSILLDTPHFLSLGRNPVGGVYACDTCENVFFPTTLGMINRLGDFP